jgi:hypothetical protein
VICLCLSIISIAGAGILFFNQTRIAQDRSLEPEVQVTPATVDEQMDTIEQQIVSIRGLEAKEAVARNILSPEELRQRVLDDFLEDYTQEDASEDALVLWGFGLLDRNFDLYQFYLDLYSEQIAGFYDQETKEMYVVQEESFKGPERLTYAHEFVHAMQDQYYDIETGLKFNDEDCEQDSERCASVSALLEGDASLAESLWFSQFATSEDVREISEFYSTFESPVYDSAPSFMQLDFLFPYQQGQDFVQTLYDSGGWESVNQAYSQPPVSTEQILHPDQYPEDLPIPITLPDLAAFWGPDWKEIDRGVMGEWYTYLILASGLESKANLSQAEAQRAAAGWEGDAYVVFYNESLDKISLILFTQWDSESEADEFGDAFEKYATNRFGTATSQSTARVWESEMGVNTFYDTGEYTAWILAPEIQTTAELWELLKDR